MATIVTRAGKGSPLTHAEVDANFTNLNDGITTAAAITGGTINNTAIGGSTPAAGTFTTLGVTTSINASGAASNINLPINSKGTGSVELATGNGVVAKAVDRGSVVDTWVEFRGGRYTFSSPYISTGTSASPGTGYSFGIENSGIGPVIFRTSPSAEQMRVSHTASAVNYVQVTGGVTGVNAEISVQGSDANRSLSLRAQGGGVIRFVSGNNGEQFRINGSTDAVNRLAVVGATAGNAPVLSVQGSDTNIDLALTPKGTGQVRPAGSVTPVTNNTIDLGTSAIRWRQVFANTFTEDTFPVVTQTDIGTAPNQVPLNQYLGNTAFMSSDQFVLNPAATANPNGIGDMIFEFTNDTTLTVKVKGSDGVVRSAALTLA